MNRKNVDLNTPFVPAAVQLTDANHLIFTGQNFYYKTAAVGFGTAGYNTSFENTRGGILRSSGWTAADYEY
jgi:hypothetical protein